MCASVHVVVSALILVSVFILCFASDVTSPFSLCPLSLPDKMFGKIFVIVLSVWGFFPPCSNVTVASSHD